MNESRITADYTLLEVYQMLPGIVEFLDSIGMNGSGRLSEVPETAKYITMGHIAGSLGLQPEELIIQIERHFSREQRFSGTRNLDVRGILPCPVRSPLTELLGSLKLKTTLQAASGGLDWFDADFKESPADFIISAGFDKFFSPPYSDLARVTAYPERLNESLSTIDLADPERKYLPLALVPAVFLVDTELLGDRRVPTSWQMLLDDSYEQSVNLPTGDLDLYHAVLLTLQQRFGPQAIEALARNTGGTLHPAATVGRNRSTGGSAVTILPWFFTKMIFSTKSLKMIWPEDGAIVSPIYGLRTSDADCSPLIDVLTSKSAGTILSHKGLFPTVVPGIDNRLPEQARFMWLGWEEIRSGDMDTRIDEVHKAFIKAGRDR